MYWESITQDKTENKNKQHGILYEVEVTEKCENSSVL